MTAVRWLVGLMVMRKHAYVARTVRGWCIVGHIKGSIRAKNMGKIVQ
jgi:hypothetical protein